LSFDKYFPLSGKINTLTNIQILSFDKYFPSSNLFNSKYLIGKAKRTCRCGAGEELTPGLGDTPGFPMVSKDEIYVDKTRGNIKFLRLKRSHARLKQTSTSMLQSWRANCDVAILLYNHNPYDVNPSDIAAISGYVTSYCTKGNATFQSERQSIAALINSVKDDITNDQIGTISLGRKILNNFITQRVMSRAEVSCSLMDLPLISCTETFENIYLNSYKRVRNLKRKKTNLDESSTSNIITQYSTRPKNMRNISLFEYTKMHLQEQKLKNPSAFKKPRIIHPLGMSGTPIFPPTSGYAKTTLIMYKPWSRSNRLLFEDDSTKLLREFESFLQSDCCPIDVIMKYEIAIENYERRLKNKECSDELDDVALDNDTSCHPDAAMLISCCQSFHKSDQLNNLDKGIDYDWSKINVVVPEAVLQQCHPSLWLKNTIYEYNFNKGSMIMKPKSSVNLDIVQENPEQRMIVFSVLKKIKEWIEFPKLCQTNPNATFEPLHMTIQGSGGTGKTTITKLMINSIMTLFLSNDVCVVCAPTGAAAFRVGGITIHSFLELDIHDYGKNISNAKRQRLIQKLKHLLLLVFDERSLISMGVLGAAEHHCKQTAHGERNKRNPWGNIPVVILMGDDYQLPSVSIGKRGHGATKIFDVHGKKRDITDITEANGAMQFLKMGQNVVELKKSHRIARGDKELSDICQSLRHDDGLSAEHTKTLLNLHIDNPSLSDERKKFLDDKAMWLFHTNKQVNERNFEKLCQKVTKSNPLYSSKPTYSTTNPSSRKPIMKTHFDAKDRIKANTSFVRGSRVALTRNLWPEMGLYNGSMATVKDIVFENNTSPLKGDFPSYIILDIDDYCGPPWFEDHPTFVPITPLRTSCKHNCCSMNSITLTLAEARTLHKFQGNEAGPNFPIEAIVCDIGDIKTEANNTGFTNTAIGRAATLGMGNIEESAFYLTGTPTESRLRDIVHKRSSRRKLKYDGVRYRDNWVAYLNQNQIKSTAYISDDEVKKLEEWFQRTTISEHQLEEIIAFHAKYN